MTATLPELVPSIDDEGSSGIIVAEGREFASMADLLAAYPGLTDDPAQMAVAVNSFAQNIGFVVILDPQAYEAAARERIASEDPNAPFVQGVYRLRDFGMPKFAAISAPAITGGKLIFCAEQDLTGLPYKVTVGLDGGNPVYDPLPLDPLPEAGPPEDPDSIKPPVAEEEGDTAPPENLPEGDFKLPDGPPPAGRGEIDENPSAADGPADAAVIPRRPGLSAPGADDDDDEDTDAPNG